MSVWRQIVQDPKWQEIGECVISVDGEYVLISGEGEEKGPTGCTGYTSQDSPPPKEKFKVHCDVFRIRYTKSDIDKYTKFFNMVDRDPKKLLSERESDKFVYARLQPPNEVSWNQSHAILQEMKDILGEDTYIEKPVFMNKGEFLVFLPREEENEPLRFFKNTIKK